MNDKKLGVSSNNSTVDYFNPQMVSAQDYYPFGMLQPGRDFNAGGYRYGFNGKENDNEVKGVGNLQDYGMRIYDPRLGKFLSVDPLTGDYPWYTPYQFAGNMPVSAIDLDGTEPKKAGTTDEQVEKAPDGQGKVQDWSWSKKDKVWTLLLTQVTVSAYSKKYHKPLAGFIETYYKEDEWQNTLDIGKDLANLLFLKELKKKMPGVPGLPDDVKGTYDMIKKKVKDEDLKNLLNASETIIKNRLDGMQMAKEGTLELVTNLIPVKKLGDALRLLDKTLLVAGLNPAIYDYNLAIVSHLDFQQTRLQFEFTVNMNAHLMKHDHLYILPVTYKQFCQIMSEKFVVLDDYKKQIGLRIYNDAPNPDFQKANFGGEKPAFFLYFNKVGDKGFLHVSEMGVKPIQ